MLAAVRKDALYLLRWRYDFLCHNMKYGQWDREADRMEDMACFNLKEGLVRASIEGKDIVTREIKVLAECNGHDFCLFKHMAVATAGMSINFRNQTRDMAKANVGLKMVTRDHFIEVYKSGLIRKLDRPEEDKKFHYAAYGK